MKRARIAVAAAVALTLALAAPAPASAAAPTQRATYTPFAAGGALRAGLHAVDRAGECFTTSSLIGRRGVYRCITGNILRDPCYLDPAAADPTVICVADPWRRTVVRIALRDPLPADEPIGAAGRPWALELASGARCVFVTGASQLAGGYRLNYVCDRDRFLFGLPRTSAATWRIRQSASAAGRRMRLVAIARAWR
jgi:hypothetical protein